ncbi:hypothetical protein HELRODRAFT_184907 [Helobdella robusta]|uniref:Cytochrome P450 n=1 Tax=Helobdella robusta TaxID=6412 RepID=T1FM58_HELRO|nr:hypothetical protein HELRODRAFT_184907 [Helobdella robusta]ESO05948.1 hypothetical protein HELRODRAFT_184907 [Helobdella robusta]
MTSLVSALFPNIASTERLIQILTTIPWLDGALYVTIFLITWVVYQLAILPFLSPLRKVPGLPYNPIVGNMMYMFSGEGMESHIKMVNQYGPYVRYYFLYGKERLLIADPEGMRHVMVTNSKNYERPKNKLKYMIMLLMNGLVTSGGARHAVHKKLMFPAFNNKSINGMFAKFHRQTGRLVNYWKKLSAGDFIVHVHNDLTRITLDVIGETAFGFNFDSLEHPDFELGKVFHELVTGIPLSFKLLIPFYADLPSPTNKRFKKNVEFVRNFVQNIIDSKKIMLESGSDRENVTNDVLGMMMVARDEETGEGMSDGELTDHVVTLMMAGHETTAVAIAWCLLMLAKNENVQEKLRNEVETFHLRPDEIHSIEVLDSLEYCDCVVKETLRLYPPIPFTLRKSLKADVIAGYKIPAGTLMMLSMGAMMRRADLYEDPEKFIPERFFGISGPERSLNSFLPFITGPRMCLGYKFALVEIKLTIMALISNFKFETLPEEKDYKRKAGLTMRPDPTLRLKLIQIIK